MIETTKIDLVVEEQIQIINSVPKGHNQEMLLDQILKDLTIEKRQIEKRLIENRLIEKVAAEEMMLEDQKLEKLLSASQVVVPESQIKIKRQIIKQ